MFPTVLLNYFDKGPLPFTGIDELEVLVVNNDPSIRGGCMGVAYTSDEGPKPGVDRDSDRRRHDEIVAVWLNRVCVREKGLMATGIEKMPA